MCFEKAKPGSTAAQSGRTNNTTKIRNNSATPERAKAQTVGGSFLSLEDIKKLPIQRKIKVKNRTASILCRKIVVIQNYLRGHGCSGERLTLNPIEKKQFYRSSFFPDLSSVTSLTRRL